MQRFQNNLDSFASVSYTHLDVYKRQNQQRGQAEQDRDLSHEGQQAREATDGIRQPHDAQILIGDVRDFMREHTRQLAWAQACLLYTSSPEVL